MLVLGRKVREQVRIGENITVTVVRIDRSTVRLGFDAPDGIIIDREEVAKIKDREKGAPDQ